MSDEDPPILKHELSEDQTVQELGEHRITVSRAQNVAEVLAKLEPLLNGQGNPPKQRWDLCLDGKGIRRSFYFKGFRKTWVGGDVIHPVGCRVVKLTCRKELHAGRCRGMQIEKSSSRMVECMHGAQQNYLGSVHDI